MTIEEALNRVDTLALEGKIEETKASLARFTELLKEQQHRLSLGRVSYESALGIRDGHLCAIGGDTSHSSFMRDGQKIANLVGRTIALEFNGRPYLFHPYGRRTS